MRDTRTLQVRNAIYQRIAERVIEHNHQPWKPLHLCNQPIRWGWTVRGYVPHKHDGTGTVCTCYGVGSCEVSGHPVQ